MAVITIWIARDLDGTLVQYGGEKPYKKDKEWRINKQSSWYSIIEETEMPHIFNDIRWTDKEPKIYTLS